MVLKGFDLARQQGEGEGGKTNNGDGIVSLLAVAAAERDHDDDPAESIAVFIWPPLSFAIKCTDSKYDILLSSARRGVEIVSKRNAEKVQRWEPFFLFLLLLSWLNGKFLFSVFMAPS